MLALAAPAAFAQGERAQRDAPNSAASTQRAERDNPARQVGPARASEIIGLKVRNTQGEDLGEVKDLFVDPAGGAVRFLVLGFGGVLGLGEKLFPYPMNAFRFDPAVPALVLNVPRERLAQAPGFPMNEWPATGASADQGYWDKVESFFRSGSTSSSAQAKAERTSNPYRNLRRGSELMKMDVKSGEREVGEVEDLLVELPGGRVHAVVVELQGGKDQRIALAPNAFSQVQEKALVTRRNADELRSAPAFDARTAPSLARKEHNDRVDDVTRAGPNVATPVVLDGRVFQRLDANGDGRLTREEARIDGTVEKVFGQIDVNSDGNITRDEARRHAESQPKQDPAQSNARAQQR